jgi:photosystem II stability/assembly factor-like uncharacterized protein
MKTATSKLVVFAQFIAVASVALFGMDSRSAKVNPPTGGQTGYRWTSVGPSPPAIPAAIASHAASHTIYIGSIGGGVLKSTNGGATFNALSSLPTSEVMSMVMDPGNPNIVYAGGFKTTDGGATWAAQSDGGGFAMVMDPTNSNIIYSSFTGVSKTIDGGETWQSVSNGLGATQIFSLAINPFNPNVIFAGSTGDGAFKSADGGNSWTPVSIDSTVYGLLVDPDDGNIVYAGSNGDGVYKSTDGGNSFARIGSPAVGVVLSIVKSGSKLYAGTAGGGVSVSDDGGVTWRNAGVPKSMALMLSVDSEGSVYAGTNFHGAFVLSAHKEAKWHRLAWEQLKTCACQQGHALAVDPADPNHVFFTTNDGGILVTEDGGTTWKDGGTKGFVARAPRGVAFDPQDTRRVYAGSAGGGFFKSVDHGRHWRRRRFGWSTNYTTGVSVDPFDHSIYIATIGNLGIPTNGIWKSTDFGETFNRIDRAPNAPPDQFLDLSGRGITVDPHRHGTVYFADRTGGTWRSQDAGATWYNVDATGAFSITVDPTDSNIVYVGASDATGVLKSIDGGTSFVPKNVGLPGIQSPRTGSVQVNPENPKVIYVGTQGAGIFRSNDGGEKWHAINLGLPDLNVSGFVLAPGSPNSLYAATFSSVFKKRTAP